MKRKFFSLFVAAMAAVASLTCFSGCSGGGEEHGTFLWKEYRTGNVQITFLDGDRIKYKTSGNVYYENEVVCEQEDCEVITSDGTTITVYSRMDIESAYIVNGRVRGGVAILNLYGPLDEDEDDGDAGGGLQAIFTGGHTVENGNANMSRVILDLTFNAENDGTFKVADSNGTTDHFHVNYPDAPASNY